MNSPVRPKSGGIVEGDLIPSLRGIKVSVIMVAYRTGPALAETLERALGSDDLDELVVVDNGSASDEEAVMDAAAAKDRRCRVLRGQGNVGFARGANLGASASRGRILVFLNPDAFLEPGCIEALETGLKGRPSPCLVGARVMNLDGTEQRGARRGEVTPVSTFLSITKLAHKVRAFRGYEIHHEADPEPSGPTPVPTISGACFAMTRTDFAAVGGFDEGYFLHVEDIDLCWRVRKSGGEVLFQPAARVIHLGSTSRKAPLLVEYWKGLGLARYFHKRADTGASKTAAWVLAPVIVAVSVVRAVMRRRARP